MLYLLVVIGSDYELVVYGPFDEMQTDASICGRVTATEFSVERVFKVSLDEGRKAVIEWSWPNERNKEWKVS